MSQLLFGRRSRLLIPPLIGPPGTITADSIQINWTDNSTWESGFKVERATAAAGPFAQIGTAAANATSYSDTGLAAETTYYYRMRAYNGSRNGAYSAVDSETTAAAGLAITAPTIFWTMDAVSGNEAATIGGITLTDNNTVTSAAGKVNTSRQFTAADSEYFTAADAAGLQLNTDTTIGFWIYLDSKATLRSFVNKGTGNTTSTTEYFAYYSSVANTIRVSIYDTASNAYDHDLLSNPSTGTWYCICVKWDGARVYGSINGANWDGGTAAAAYPRTTAGDLKVGGRDPASLLPMDGRIEALSIWKGTLLTNAEVGLFYNSGNGTQFNGTSWSL